MKSNLAFTTIFLFLLSAVSGQNSSPTAMEEKLPYEEIGLSPESYTAGTVAARMIDGLGYRYYWATEGLREEDLAYKPSEDARTTMETLLHLYGLSGTIINASKNAPNIRPAKNVPETYEALRAATLKNLAEASEILKNNPEKDLSELNVIFQNGDNTSEFPYWNMINGPIADAIYHTGQLVSFRRITGNPMNPKVSVFMGKNRP
ncbi:MAG: hypothetical protein R8P61_13675 [Bacteroidia bacterium]|nr:hypothetical protein [Bacteroidia bacterium]